MPWQSSTSRRTSSRRAGRSPSCWQDDGMTAPSLALPRSLDGEALLRRLTPSEGWATLAAVAVLAMSFGWSLDDAGWIPSLEGSTAYLPWLALLATAVGIGLIKIGLGRL